MDGVNPANGNLVYQKNDLSIPGRGIPVSMTRTYNNRKSHVTGMFGYGWTSNVEKRLVDGGTGPITQTDGTKENYNASGSRLGTFLYCP
ncbi:DUF6531 domain-containing protein [Peribacillus butanolivorans]|uniref:DUF6531 domain-containing protein n=1 Tax=Peribacillus butanolivorans TaxID=421767 RepID=UPI0036422EE6